MENRIINIGVVEEIATERYPILLEKFNSIREL